jgi:hypothetical protein
MRGPHVGRTLALEPKFSFDLELACCPNGEMSHFTVCQDHGFRYKYSLVVVVRCFEGGSCSWYVSHRSAGAKHGRSISVGSSALIIIFECLNSLYLAQDAFDINLWRSDEHCVRFGAFSSNAPGRYHNDSITMPYKPVIHRHHQYHRRPQNTNHSSTGNFGSHHAWAKRV